jgi:hypothetical protein
MERRPRQCSGALRATAVPGHHREALGYLRKHPEPGVGISWARQLQNCSLFDGRCYGTAFLRELYFCSKQARLEVYWTSCILGGFDEWRRSIPSQFARSVARGRVCRAPSKNTFCIDLDRIGAERDEAKEDVIHGKDFSELKEGEFPPCQADSGAFMNDKTASRIVRRSLPVQTHDQECVAGTWCSRHRRQPPCARGFRTLRPRPDTPLRCRSV